MFKLHPQLAIDCIFIGDLSLCSVLLMNDARFPWCILVPRRENIAAMHELAKAEQHQLMDESSFISKSMLDVFKGNKINVAALGNVVPQLHIHHVIRFSNDEVWPRPVWGSGSAQPYEAASQQAVVSDLQLRLSRKKCL